MRAVLEAYSEKSRSLRLFDSFILSKVFRGPMRSVIQEIKMTSIGTVNPYLGVSLDQVKANFERYELLDQRVIFTKG